MTIIKQASKSRNMGSSIISIPHYSINTIDREELAWAAGFFDGEGYIGCVPNRERWVNLRINIGQCQIEPLERFQNAVLGLGKIKGPYLVSKYNPNANPIYSYEVRSFAIAQAVMAMIWPFLSLPKRSQFSQAMFAWKDHHELLNERNT